MKEHSLTIGEYSYDKVESLCFETIQQEIYNSVIANIKNSDSYRICKDRVDVSLPVRVNWGGGWSDTPDVYKRQALLPAKQRSSPWYSKCSNYYKNCKHYL